MKYINIITCTFKRNNLDRIKLIEHLKNLLTKEECIRWLVVDDNNCYDDELSRSLPDFAKYFFIGPSRDKGHLQRNLALEYIYDNNLEGLVYNADDDNRYDQRIFSKLRETKRFSIIPVGNLGPNRIVEKAILSDGKFVCWNSPWKDRKYAVDMAAFCFDAKLLKKLEKPLWKFEGLGGETEFIEKLINSVDDIEFLAHDDPVYVWHNGLTDISI